MAEPPFKRFGKYEIQAELGRGGFGRVFRAFDPTVGRLVAIKILTSEAGTDMFTRFRNEAMAAGNLRHENLITIYEFGQEDGVPFIAMEYLEGEDLQQTIRNSGKLTLLEKIEIMSQAAAGLECAHRHGVVHRDVKPANIRVLQDGTVKILDFGIARLLRDEGVARLTHQGHVIGTLLYMAPEQVMGSDPDVLCDVFAYGVVFYELLTGCHPFRAEDPRSIFYKITTQDPLFLHDLVPDCPEAVDHVVRRAMQKDRELRYQSLRDLRLDIEPVLIDLRRERAKSLVGEAQHVLSAGDLAHSRSLLNDAIRLDPANTAARDLRESIQIELRKQTIRPRIEALVKKADHSLSEGNYSGALDVLSSALRLAPEDEALKARYQDVEIKRNQSRESARLLSEARTHQADGQLTVALEKAAEAVTLAPDNSDAQTFLQTVKREIERRETQRRLAAKLARAQQLLEDNSVDEALSAMNALDTAERNTPEALDLTARLSARKAERDRERRIWNELKAAGELADADRFTEALESLEHLRFEFQDDRRIRALMAEIQRMQQQRSAPIAASNSVARSGEPTLIAIPEASKAAAERARQRMAFPRDRKLLLLGAICALFIAVVLAAMRLLRPGAAPASLTIETEPPGAIVRVDGRSCATPTCRLLLSAGNYRIEARLSGYSTLTREVAVRSGENSQMQLVLSPVPARPKIPEIRALVTSNPEGMLLVEANVDGASVSVDRRRLASQTQGGRLRIPLKPGDYNVEVQKQGYRVSPPRIRAGVRNGIEFRATFRLEPKPAMIELANVLDGATVLIDGAAAGTVQHGNFSVEVTAGAHTVGLVKEGYKSVSTQTSAALGETVKLNAAALRLEAIPKPDVQAAQKTPPQPPRAAPPSAEEIEAADWDSARAARDRSSIQAFLRKYPSSARREEAVQMLAQLDWNTLDHKNRAALERFAAQYSGTSLAQQAAAELERMTREAAATAQKSAEDEVTAERREISSVLTTYAAAFDRKDLNLLKTVWPGLPESDLARAFSQKGTIRSELRPIAPIEINGDQASVRCTRTTEQMTQFGRQRPIEQTRTVRFQKKNGHWIISSID